MQGGGQEFESPRLHHLRPTAPNANRRDPGRPREPPASTAAPAARIAGGATHRTPDQCPSCPEATDQRIAGAAVRPCRAVAEARASGPHLNNWIVFRQIEDLRFRRVVKEISRSKIPPAADRLVRCWRGSSYKGHGVDALAPRADEGRGRLRKASGSREQTLIRRCPNGETRLGSCPVTPG